MALKCEARTLKGDLCRCRVAPKNVQRNTVKDALGFEVALLCPNHWKVLCRGNKVKVWTGKGNVTLQVVDSKLIQTPERS